MQFDWTEELVLVILTNAYVIWTFHIVFFFENNGMCDKTPINSGRKAMEDMSTSTLNHFKLRNISKEILLKRKRPLRITLSVRMYLVCICEFMHVWCPCFIMYSSLLKSDFIKIIKASKLKKKISVRKVS